MPRSSQFFVIYHDAVLRLHPDNEILSSTLGPFNLADLDTDPTLNAILTFKMTGANDIVQTIWNFNDSDPFLNYQFDVPEPEATQLRSWHEIFPAADLQTQNNRLVIRVDGPGVLIVSDIVLFYRTSLP